jgi:hypothetical protein
MKKLLLITVFALSATYVNGQITFQKTFGGLGWDNGYSVQQTTDGGYIIAGSTSTNSSGVGNVYLIKTNSNGDTLWTKSYGGWDEDYGICVQQTTDGGFVITGGSESFGAGSRDVYLIKTAANGDTLWTKTYGGWNSDDGYSIRQTTDGGYVIVGLTSSFGGITNVYLIKTDANGNPLWSKAYGGNSNEEGNSVQQTNDGGFIIAGSTESFGVGNYDVYLIKTNSNGDTLWTKTYGGIYDDHGYSVQQTTDNGYIVVGVTESFGGGSQDIYLVKTNNLGDVIWTKTYGDTLVDWGDNVQQTTDGGYIIVGSCSYNVYLIKTNANGGTLWTKIFGGVSNLDYGYSVQQTTDGGYIIAGSTDSFGIGNIYLIKTDANGNGGCNQLDTTTITTSPATQQTSPSTIIINPTTIVSNTATIMRSGGVVTTLCTNVSISEISSNSESINVYPNPTSDNLTIETPQKATIEIINIQGQIIKTLQTTDNKTSVDVSALSGGVYIIKLITGEGSVVRKFIKQ